MFTVDLEESRMTLERCVALFEQSRSQNLRFVTPENPAVAALSVLPLTLWLLGRPDEAVRRKEEALVLAEGLGHPFNIAFVHCWATALHQWRGEPALGAEHARAAVRICDDYGFAAWGRVGKVHLSIALGAMGETETAMSLFESVRPILEFSGTVCFTSYFVTGIAKTLQVAGLYDQALEQIEVALSIVNKYDERFFEAEIYRLRAIVRLALPEADPAAAEQDLLKAVDIAGRQQSMTLHLRALTSLCRLHRDLGRGDRKIDDLRAAYEAFSEGFDTADLQEARALLNA
jgi:tetratricopeptide (TPR) repeat protein